MSDSFEREAMMEGYSLVAGVDEAGRGPLAGPVVAAAVVFGYHVPGTGHAKLSAIKDSKTLTPERREALLPYIHCHARAVGVGIVWPEEIDRVNILNATLCAMEQAVLSLSEKGVVPDFLLIDGTHSIKKFPIPQKTIISGDKLSVSIAAASIVAKTARDKIMRGFHRIYPEYNFSKNKGYGTGEHISAIQTHGPSPIHRKTFRRVK